MRMKTIKLNWHLFSNLVKINKDVNFAIEELMRTLYNEAHVFHGEKVISNYEDKIKENEKKIEEIPINKTKYLMDVKKEANLKLGKLNLQKKAVSLKLKYNKIINPRFEYEEQIEWTEILEMDYVQALESINTEINKIEETLKNVDENVMHAKEWEQQEQDLLHQNKRMYIEIDRAKKIVETQKLLKE